MRLSGGRRYWQDYDALPDAACNVPFAGDAWQIRRNKILALSEKQSLSMSNRYPCSRVEKALSWDMFFSPRQEINRPSGHTLH